MTKASSSPTPPQPCRSPYCECDIGKCTHPGFYDARGSEKPTTAAECLAAAYAEASAIAAPDSSVHDEDTPTSVAAELRAYARHYGGGVGKRLSLAADMLTVLADEVRRLRVELAYWMPTERPKFGAPGSRDVDVAAAQRKWDAFHAEFAQSADDRSTPAHAGLAAAESELRQLFEERAWLPADVYLCRASGEGSHNFRVCTDEAGVMAFYDEMFGKAQDGSLDSSVAHFRDPENWGNCGTAYSCELYCATFEVWKVDPRELGIAQSASERSQAEQACLDIYNDFDENEAKSLTVPVYEAWKTGMSLMHGTADSCSLPPAEKPRCGTCLADKYAALRCNLAECPMRNVGATSTRSNNG